MKKRAIWLVLFISLSVAFIGLSFNQATAAGSVKMTGVNDSYDLAVGGDQNSQVFVTISPALASAPGNDVTLHASLDSSIPQLAITAGQSLVFTPLNFATAQNVVVAITGSIDPGKTAVISLSGSGIETKATTIKTVQGNAPPPATLADCYDGTAQNIRDCSLSERIADPTGYVYKAWQATRGIINILLILALLAISFSNILHINIDTYTVKKALPNLVIGVILANASFLIIRYMADIATVATYLFVNLANFTSFQEFITAVLRTVGTDTLNTIGVAVNNPVIAPFIVILMTIVAVIGIVWMAFLFYVRLVAIYLLTILAPLAFVAYGLPGFEKYFKMWWQQFIKWLFILPAISAVLWIEYLVCTAGGNNDSIARTITCYFLFFTALGLPSKMGGAIIDKASKAFQKYTGVDAARKFATEQAQNTGQAILSRTPGVYRIQEWNKLRKANFEKSLKNRRDAATTRASSGFAGRRASLLDLQAERIGLESEIQKGENQRSVAERNKALLVTITEKKKLKETVEKQLGTIRAKVDLEFAVSGNKKQKEIFQDWLRANFDQEAITGRVGRAENIEKGSYASNRKIPLQALLNYKAKEDLQKAAQTPEEKERYQKEMDEIKTTFNSKIAGYKDAGAFGDLNDQITDFDSAMKTWNSDDKFINEQVKAYQKQGFKGEMASVDATIEDDVKYTPIAVLESKFRKQLSDTYNNASGDQLKAIKQFLLAGDTAGLTNFVTSNGITNKDGEAISDYQIKEGLLHFTTLQRKFANRYERNDAAKLIAKEMQDAYGDQIGDFEQSINVALNGSQKDQSQAISFLNNKVGVFQGPFSGHQIDSNKDKPVTAADFTAYTAANKKGNTSNQSGGGASSNTSPFTEEDLGVGLGGVVGAPGAAGAVPPPVGQPAAATTPPASGEDELVDEDDDEANQAGTEEEES